MLSAKSLVLGVMGELALTVAVVHSLAAAALLKLHLAGRLVQLVVFAGGVGASVELSGQLHVHSVIQSQGELRHAKALVEAVLGKEVYIRTLACLCSVGVPEECEYSVPRCEQSSYFGIAVGIRLQHSYSVLI